MDVLDATVLYEYTSNVPRCKLHREEEVVSTEESFGWGRKGSAFGNPHYYLHAFCCLLPHFPDHSTRLQGDILRQLEHVRK